MTSDGVKHVFVSYVREDTEQVNKLCALLDAAQIPYWCDRTSLAPGEHWKQTIRDAIRSGALVFLACFSTQSRAKAKSYMNEELTIAVEEFRKLPPGAIWLIPVRFDYGDIPEWDLGAGRTLRDLNYADLYGDKYPSEAVKLTTTISRIIGTAGTGAATVRASIEEADVSERPAMMRRMTKEMVLDPTRRIELDDLVNQETKRILAAMRDEELFPTYMLTGTDEDRLVRCAEVAASYWQLVQPLCASIQVATRWADTQGLAPWVYAIRAITFEAMKPKVGTPDLIDLRHVPALTTTFAAALAAVGQGRWDNLKTLLVDTTFPRRNGKGSQALVQVEDPWTPFPDQNGSLPHVVAIAAKTGENPRAALGLHQRVRQVSHTVPVAEWLHTILRPHFTDQHPDDAAFDNAFDMTEIMLGLISQDLEKIRFTTTSERTWKGQSNWFGRSTRPARLSGDPLGDTASEIKARGQSWAPVVAGLFGGELDRATVALENYQHRVISFLINCYNG